MIDDDEANFCQEAEFLAGQPQRVVPHNGRERPSSVRDVGGPTFTSGGLTRKQKLHEAFGGDDHWEH